MERGGNKPARDTHRAFGRRVKELRESLNLTQRRLAELMNTGQSQIGEIETGRQNITLDTAIKLATALNTQVRELFGPDPDQLNLKHVGVVLRVAVTAIDDELEVGKRHLDLGVLHRLAQAVTDQIEAFVARDQSGTDFTVTVNGLEAGIK